MKHPLRLSLAANLFLFLLVLALVTQLHRLKSAPKEQLAPTPAATVENVAVRAEATESGFRWGELEFGGARAYISHLRQIGCPERTVRDIVQGDVDRLYNSRRARLNLDGQGTGPWSLDEEERLLSHLLGLPPESFRANEPYYASAAQPGAAEGLVSLPLVLGLDDPEGLGLDEGQLQGLEELREQFIAEVGGLNQAPDDPAYAQRWRLAQPRIDALVPGLIGRGAFLRMQLESGAGLDQ